jgi:hypothetical protein
MRQLAQQKQEMNESKAQGRVLANGKDGLVMLGGVPLPEAVLQGRGLRALWEAQQDAVPVAGLFQGERFLGVVTLKRGCCAARMRALLVVAHSDGCAACVHAALEHHFSATHGGRGRLRTAHAHARRPGSAAAAAQPTSRGVAAGPAGGSKAREAEAFVESQSRHGLLTAPPQAFLALMTDWGSLRTTTTAPPQ